MHQNPRSHRTLVSQPISQLTTRVFFASILAGCSAGALAQSDPPPNIVLIMTDDQGLGDLTHMGNPVLETPNIDILATQSVFFDRFYVSAVCSPTRASLMTGRHNYRTRVVDTWVGRSMMEPEEVTIAEVLRSSGYTTGIFGKWHLGDCYPMRPQDQGFDEVLVHRGGGLAQPSEPVENNRRYTDPILFHNGQQVQTTGYCTDVYFDAAAEFIESAAEQGKPFFAYVATNAPHDPYHDVPEQLYQKYKAMDLSEVLPEGSRFADDLARVFAMCENIDDNVGSLMRTLDELGVRDNTIVVYLHDNGPRILHYNVGLRGKKTMPYEGGVRSPLLVRWPGVLSPGRVVTQIAAHIDLLPTILEGIGMPADQVSELCDNPIDGRSLWPLMTEPDDDESVVWQSRYLFFQTHRGDVPVPRHHFAVVGERWKLVRHSGFNFESPRDGSPIMLVDLDADPAERVNLAEQEPERFGEMLRAYDEWFVDVSSTREGNYDPPRIIIGTDHETRTTLTHQDSRRWFEGDFKKAKWLLDAEGDHDFTVRVLADSDHTRGEVTLFIQQAGGPERHITSSVNADSRWTIFRDIEFEPGPADIWISYDDTDVPTTAYHVVIERAD